MPTPIFELCDRHVQRSCELDPVAATYRGVAGEFAPGTDLSPDGHAARAELTRETLQALAGLTPTNDADRLAAAHLSERLTAEHASYEAGDWLRSLRAPFGLLQSLRNSAELMPRGDQHQWRAVVARVAAMPQMLAGWRSTLALGVQRQVVAARRQALEAANQADQYAASATFGSVLAEYGDGPQRTELIAATEAAHAAFAETARWLRDEYAPHAATVDGVGSERYAVASQLSLGAEIDPVEAYHWAWEELHRIEAELHAEAGRVRAGASIEEAIEHLNETEYLLGIDTYRSWLQERHDQAIAALHGVHFDIAEPLRRVDVVTVEGSAAGSAYYTPPSEDLRRPGRTWWPVADRERFGIWAELTTVFHEGVPGHHLQLGHVLVAADQLSRFSRMSRVSANSEGWALYAERLADELGWFTTPGQRLGMLKGSALRAARVVIDIGVHLDLPLPPAEAKRHGERWSFETATEVLRDRGRIARHRLHPEVVRYCGWPGQAISYKLGERAWVEARAQAQARLGAGFDLKRWHTQALALGPVGLGTLTDLLREVAG